MATGAVETMTVALDKVRALGRCPGRRWGGSTTRGLFCSQRTWASPRTTPEHVSSPSWRSGGATPPRSSQALRLGGAHQERLTLWGSAASTAAAAAAAAAGAARRGGLSGENAEGCGREVTDYGGGVVGDPRRLVALVKLVAATEGALRMSGSGGGGGFGGEEGGLI